MRNIGVKVSIAANILLSPRLSGAGVFKFNINEAIKIIKALFLL